MPEQTVSERVEAFIRDEALIPSGGDVTVLNCHIEHADTHMTLNPVAVNYQCWAARRASAHVTAEGEVEFDREF